MFIYPHCSSSLLAKKHKISPMGSFRVLNGKVDLSTHEAEITLQNWENQLENLRQQTTLSIYKEINAARTVTTVKVMAYKNGEGRMRAGEIICGSTVEGVSCGVVVSLEWWEMEGGMGGGGGGGEREREGVCVHACNICNS